MKMKCRPYYRDLGGFSLVETMIALTIGTVLVAAATDLYISSKNSYRFQSNFISNKQAQSLAVESLNRQIRMAGYRSDTSETYGAVFAAAAGSTYVPGDDQSDQSGQYKFEAGEVITGSKDSLTIRYQGDDGSTGVSLTDCAGTVVPKNQVVVLNFKISNQTLRCARVSNPKSGPMVLIAGNPNITFEYGIDTNQDGNADQYLPKTDPSKTTVSIKYVYGNSSGAANSGSQFTQVVQLRNNNP